MSPHADTPATTSVPSADVAASDCQHSDGSGRRGALFRQLNSELEASAVVSVRVLDTGPSALKREWLDFGCGVRGVRF